LDKQQKKEEEVERRESAFGEGRLMAQASTCMKDERTPVKRMKKHLIIIKKHTNLARFVVGILSFFVCGLGPTAASFVFPACVPVMMSNVRSIRRASS
jgi:hypothetical protein